MRKLDLKSLVMAIVALVMLAMTSAVQPARADDDPFAVLNRIKAAGVLKAPVMVGEEPGYIKDPNTGEWSGFYVEWAKEIADLLRAQDLNFGMRFEEADGDLRVTNPGTPPTARVAAEGGEEG